MNTLAFISLIITTLLILLLFVFIDKTKTKSQIKKAFIFAIICLLICCIGLLLQITFCSISDIPPIYFDYFVYIGTCFLPVAFLFIALIFAKTKIKFTKKYLLLFIIPILSIILLWTNDFHHLFFIEYSTNISEGIVGKYFYIHTIYTLLLYSVSILILIKYSIKNSGFFSRQALLITIGCSIPLIINLLGTFGLVKISVYVTPITFTFAILFIAFAIFKFDFLKVTPIALQRIVDRISDSYIVLNEDMIITDFNQTLLDTFKLSSSEIRNVNILDVLKKFTELNIDVEVLIAAINKTKIDDSTVTFEKHWASINKYFHIEINSIKNKNSFLGTLVLLKDVTQHNLDMQTIKENQEILIEKERLASLGQMIGGIAHNLKTPIMSISGAAEGISDLVTEYRDSVGDPEVTVEDHHAIANDIDEWITKIRTHLSYMSDIITAVKGQAVAFSDNTFNGFTIEELVKYVDILMKHELKNSLVTLNTSINLDKNTSVNGNINSLVQVINNIISNAIQAYNGEPNKEINFTLSQRNNNLVISIQDFAGGLPDKVEEKLFKEMVTTKGKNGTGLGLFMSYSNIKAHFNGNMRYETKKGEGTTFYIEIPLAVSNN
ncbi:MAG: histidine kinase N-terminal 7TM domain-containing protein [Clostridia bacterium]